MAVPVLSVIVPLYNAEKYINHLITSIFAQSYKNFELICVNDCSSDKSLEILRKQLSLHDNIILINNKSNVGAGESRNTGFLASRGRYILFLDADDQIIHNEMFSDMVVELENGQYDFVKGLYQINHNHQIRIPRNYSNYYCNSTVSIKDKYKLLLDMPALWVCMMSKDFLLKNNIIFSKVKASQDLNFWFQIVFYANQILLINKYYLQYNYLCNESAISNIRKSCHLIETFKHNYVLYKDSSYDTIHYVNESFLLHTRKFYLGNRELFLGELKGFMKFYSRLFKMDMNFLKRYDEKPKIISRLISFIKYKKFSHLKSICLK